jgi:hypothetical protein
MDDHARKERELFERLHGDPSELAVFPRAAGMSGACDPCSQMTPEWISSWCRLVIAQPPVPDVWVTLSDAVVAWMKEVFEDTRHLARLPGSALAGLDAGDDVADSLRRLVVEAAGGDGTVATGHGDAEDGSLPAADVYRISGVSPRQAAELLCHRGSAPDPGEPAGGDGQLVLVQWRAKSI